MSRLLQVWRRAPGVRWRCTATCRVRRGTAPAAPCPVRRSIHRRMGYKAARPPSAGGRRWAGRTERQHRRNAGSVASWCLCSTAGAVIPTKGSGRRRLFEAGRRCAVSAIARARLGRSSPRAGGVVKRASGPGARSRLTGSSRKAASFAKGAFQGGRVGVPLSRDEEGNG